MNRWKRGVKYHVISKAIYFLSISYLISIYRAFRWRYRLSNMLVLLAALILTSIE